VVRAGPVVAGEAPCWSHTTIDSGLPICDSAVSGMNSPMLPISPMSLSDRSISFQCASEKGWTLYTSASVSGDW